MRHLFPLAAFAAALLVSACGDSSMVSVATLAPPPAATTPPGAVSPPPVANPPPAEVAAKSCVDADTLMTERVNLLGPAETRSVIVTFEGKTAPRLEQLQLLESLGLSVGYFKRLPIASVVASKAQIELIQKLPGVRSVRFNDRLTYDDDVARNLSTVDRAREQPELVNAAGEPITGKGVAILVNDSGVDATHPDLEFRVKVLENAQAHTNARAQTGDEDRGMYPFTPTEGVPNTDVGGSHGTHVAGIAGGDGTASDGKFAGSARGASLIGYGSGAVIFVLDGIGGFDYALKILDEHPEYNLRIITNSYGNTGDVDTCFDPADPTNVASKMVSDRKMIVVFSAGNAGSGHGTITGNFKKAPWVLVAGNGEKTGLLAPSSSRGRLAGGIYETEVDGEKFIVEDRPSVVTPGTDYISTRAVAADPFTPLDTEADIAAGDIPEDQLIYYTHKTGTSMAAPHLAGLTALILEANPDITWREAKAIFKATATNMPGYAPWEVGAGFANAEAAIATALKIRGDYGATVRLLRGYWANVFDGGNSLETYDLVFDPSNVAHTVQEFEVGSDVALVVAKYSVPDAPVCTCAVVLTDPDGNRYGSGIALPVLGANVAATAPGKPGKWTVQMRGVGSVSGQSVPNAGNGTAAPSTATARVEQFKVGATTGMGDTIGHAQEEAIQFAVSRRLIDGAGAAGFAPNEVLTRGFFADYLMSWGIRQTRAHSAAVKFGDTAYSSVLNVAADAVTRKGQFILDRNLDAAPAMLMDGVSFAPATTVSREEVAYALVQATGRQAAAEAVDANAALTVPDGDTQVPVVDTADISPAFKKHVYLAVQLGILDAEITTFNGVKSARIKPKSTLTRANYAGFVTRTYASIVFPS